GLRSPVRAGDTVARLGGDEFVVLARVEDFADAEALRERIVQALHTKVQVDGEVMELRASVGLAATRNARQSAEALLRRADRNMYRHKKGRKR
ncbi:GGDEF domain-containing protein, partial [Klebsiella pneumoniae]|nr:GGDEF domain-containing protein [Klebsiella pneumoniae]